MSAYDSMHALKRPAKYSWLAGTLLLVLAAAVGLPRAPKFIILALVSVFAVPTLFIMSFLFVFTGKFTGGPNPPTMPNVSTAADDIELAEAGKARLDKHEDGGGENRPA